MKISPRKQGEQTQETDGLLIAALAKLDDLTFAHSKRVQKLAIKIGKKMALTAKELKHLSLGALLHDVGKKDVPITILNKKTPLTSKEWEQMKLHPILGWNCVAEAELSHVVKGIILDHHLWANGKGGYPKERLANFKPCLLTQITTVADVVDAMTSDRPYRKALSITACLTYLEKNAGTQFNKEIVELAKKEILNFKSSTI